MQYTRPGSRAPGVISFTDCGCTNGPRKRNAQVNTGTFGRVTAQANIARQAQLALNVYF